MKKINIVQKCAIIKEGKVLFLRRSNKARSSVGYWDFPGGNWDFGETFDECLFREVREETGLRLGKTRIFYISNSGGWLVTGYMTKQATGKFRMSKEHDAYKWVSLSDAKKVRIQPPLRKMLDALPIR